VRITLQQPACPEFLCRKLYRFFVNEAEEPRAELLKPLADEMRWHDYNIAHVASVILRSQHFYAEANWRQRVKGPVELSAGLLRSLEVPRPSVRLLALALACERQGQQLFYPPQRQGLGRRQGLARQCSRAGARGNWCNDVIWGHAEVGLPSYEPLAWARRYSIAAEQAATSFLDLLLQGECDDGARDLIEQAGRGGSADGLRKALQLIVHCPEYQLA
jgi:hypothetical protein